MFEKEAEAYAIENWEYYEEGKNDSKELKQAYQQGAEFGYNKANEWHYPSTCELLGIIQGKDKVIQELKKELNSMMVSKNQQFTKARELIEELSSSLSVVGECEEEECELLDQAEQFLKENT